MEFTSLTRRVAEATGTEASEVEAANVIVDGDRHGPDVDEPAKATPVSTESNLVAAAKAPVDAKPTNGENTPAALAKSRAEAALLAARQGLV